MEYDFYHSETGETTTVKKALSPGFENWLQYFEHINETQLLPQLGNKVTIQYVMYEIDTGYPTLYYETLPLGFKTLHEFYQQTHYIWFTFTKTQIQCQTLHVFPK